MAAVVIRDATLRTTACELSHKFVLLHLLIPHWIWFQPEIAVNRDGQISFEGSDWHGAALYFPSMHPQHWSMTFDWKADVNKMRTYVFQRVMHTSSFLCTEEDSLFMALLLPHISD